MSDHTPTTESVRCAYIADFGWHAHDSGAAFDRWLAGIKAHAWQEGVVASGINLDWQLHLSDHNPYKETP